MKKTILSFFILFSISIFAQRTCHTNEKMQEMINTVPGFYEHHEETMEFIRNGNQGEAIFNRPNAPAVVVTIPVVFHVLYKNTTQNISEAQILSQLTVLNNDFRKLNSDFNSVVPAAFQSLGADVEIAFCKATRTPTGAATTGITRKSVPNSFDLENNYYTSSGEPSWDTTKYLNVWIGAFNDPSLLGFAWLPGAAGQPKDGLCISYDAFGTNGTASAPFNKGRTATHEIGHYFGLDHPWGNGGCPSSDGVADTPATDDAYYNCPSYPNNSNACTTTATGSMFMNYMDYVNDACMAFFTNGQKTVMQNTIAGPRASLLTSNGCATLGLNEFESANAIAVYPNPVSQYFMITSPQLDIDEVEIFNNAGQLVKTQKLTEVNNRINIDEFPSGVYYLRIYSDGNFVKSDKVVKK